MADWYENGKPPWDIDRPQSVVKEWIEKEDIHGNVIDIGCGTGENVLFIAENGYNIHGMDLSKIAIKKAKEKAKSRNLTDQASFEIGDVMKLSDIKQKFDTIIDCGLIHNFDFDTKQSLEQVVNESVIDGGSYLILAFNENEPMGIGPPNRLKKNEIDLLFEENWDIEYIKDRYFETNYEKGKHNAYAVKLVNNGK